jgi:hypothetical protein
MTTRLTRVALTLYLSAFAVTCNAQVYKCQDAAGKTVYADAPCARGGKPMPLPNPAKDGSANPTACNQLLDETRRLAADAQRGNAASAARRKTLVAEYQRRCAGISKSPQ